MGCKAQIELAPALGLASPDALSTGLALNPGCPYSARFGIRSFRSELKYEVHIILSNPISFAAAAMAALCHRHAALRQRGTELPNIGFGTECCRHSRRRRIDQAIANFERF
jgi:hypothetical protein